MILFCFCFCYCFICMFWYFHTEQNEISDIDLTITSITITLISQKYFLEFHLPYHVYDDKYKCQWISDRKQLELTLKVKEDQFEWIPNLTKFSLLQWWVAFNAVCWSLHKTTTFLYVVTRTKMFFFKFHAVSSHAVHWWTCCLISAVLIECPSN